MSVDDVASEWSKEKFQIFALRTSGRYNGALMSITSGKRISPYEVTSPLGEGSSPRSNPITPIVNWTAVLRKK
jgi:hypothetical protein